jgi:microcystin-dependent protein
MGTPFLGEIRLASFNFAPKGWALCDGQFLQINQNQALFAILGTTYGGNGQTTFALPDLRGRSPFHMGNGYTLGQRGGEEAHTLTSSEMPAHAHTAKGNNDNTTATETSPENNFWANPNFAAYSSTVNGVMDPALITTVGGSQAHNNLSPYSVVNFIIALIGVFPSQN